MTSPSSALVKDGRASKTQNTLRDLTETAQKTFARKDTPPQARWYTATQQLFQSAVEQSDSLSPELATGLTKLSHTMLERFTDYLQTKQDSLFTTKLMDTTRRLSALCALTRYRAGISLPASHGDLANALCLRAMSVWNQSREQAAGDVPREEVACIMLEWANAQSDPSGNITDMKAYLTIWSAFAALLGEFCRDGYAGSLLNVPYYI